jgi:hypothetical protein
MGSSIVPTNVWVALTIRLMETTPHALLLCLKRFITWFLTGLKAQVAYTY